MLSINKISVGVLNSRKDFINDCIQSVIRQFYPNEFMELVLINNLGKKYSIGAGYNEIVRKAKFDWVLFLGDDDMIARTYLFNLNAILIHFTEKNPLMDIVAVVTNLTLIDEKKRLGLDVVPTGMWQKKFLLGTPFDEKLDKFVDTDMFSKVNQMPDKYIIRDHTNYGYYYRQHTTNVSKNKFKEKTKIFEEMNKKLKLQEEYAG